MCTVADVRVGSLQPTAPLSSKLRNTIAKDRRARGNMHSSTQRATRSSQHAACNVQQGMCNASNRHAPIHCMKRATCSTQHAARNMQHPPNSTQHTTCLKQKQFDHVVVAQTTCNHQRSRAGPATMKVLKGYSRSTQGVQAGGAGPAAVSRTHRRWDGLGWAGLGWAGLTATLQRKATGCTVGFGAPLHSLHLLQRWIRTCPARRG
jgi:hypothetical protein